MVYVFLAEGFELIEAMIPVDVLRRAGLEVTTVSISSGLEVASANGVTVIADSLYSDNDYSKAELLLLPGGMPGAENLAAHKALCKELSVRHAKGGLIAAICASPALVLAPLGILKGKRATCYPGFEGCLGESDYRADLVATDGNVITAEGPAAALPFAYEITR
ncbi:MAG: DJ-1/PfpI family protein, partial [Bacteroidales bacterium]|nr:DJ-1/PfpI family protein [Bacteroidales bacterium]